MDYDLLEKLFQLIKEQSLDIKFIFSGGGEKLEYLKALLQRYELIKKTEFHDEFVTWESRSAPYLKSDIFIYLSIHAGWGLVVPEAMASENLVIASDKTDSANFLIQDGTNGYLYHSHSQFLEKFNFCYAEVANLQHVRKAAGLDSLSVDAKFMSRQLLKILDIFNE